MSVRREFDRKLDRLMIHLLKVGLWCLVWSTLLAVAKG